MVDGGSPSPRTTRADLLCRELVDGAMLYDAVHQRVHHLNETAALVWAACRRGETTEAIAAELGRRYDVPDPQARDDVEALLRTFAASGLFAP